MADRNINDLIFNLVSYNIPPVCRHYNRQVGDEYNPIEGYVMQWPDGTMIITGSYDLGGCRMQSYKWGNAFYRSNSQNMPHLEAEFKEVPVIIHNAAGPQGGGGLDGDGATGWLYRWYSRHTTTKMSNAYFCRPTTGNPHLQMQFVAIGEWKTYEGGSAVNLVEKIKKNDADLYMCPDVTVYGSGRNKDRVIKFQNGLMIISGVRNLGSKAITSAWGSLYETSSAFSVGTFPVSFTSAPHVFLSPTDYSVPCLLQIAMSGTTTNIGNTWALSATSTTGTVEIAYLAIGMWK